MRAAASDIEGGMIESVWESRRELVCYPQRRRALAVKREGTVQRRGVRRRSLERGDECVD